MKKILILLLCLALVALMLVACDSKNKNDDEDENDTTETTKVGGTDSSDDGTDSSADSTDSSVGGIDSSIGGTDSSVGGTDSSVGGTDSSVGGTDSSDETTDSSGNGTDTSEGTTGSGAGGTGDENPDEPSNTELYAALKDKLSALVNYEIESVQTHTVGSKAESYTVVCSYNGSDEQMVITSGNVSESVWYVDGVYYFYNDGRGLKATIPFEKYASYRGDGLGSVGFAVSIPYEWIKDISVKEIDAFEVYTVCIDGEKYTERLDSSGATGVVYNDIVYDFYFDASDENGTLTRVSAESSYVQNGTDVTVSVESEIDKVGLVLVEKPENGDIFTDVTELLK